MARSEKRRRTELLVVRLTPTERAVLDSAVAVTGWSVAEYVRRHLFTDSAANAATGGQQ